MHCLIEKYFQIIRSFRSYEVMKFLPDTCDFPLAPLLEDSVSDENDDSDAAIVAIFYIRKNLSNCNKSQLAQKPTKLIRKF